MSITPVRDPDFRDNRINIDTGAYATGKLTCLIIEQDELALLSKKTWRADGARWEMNCAAEEVIPGIGVHIHEDDKGSIPPELRGRVINWHWDSITNFLDRVDGKRSLWDRLLS